MPISRGERGASGKVPAGASAPSARYSFVGGFRLCMQAKDAIEFWGAALIRWPVGLAKRLGLPPPDCDYLQDVGLPVNDEWTFRVERPMGHPRTEMGFVVVALDGPTPICVDPTRPMRVIAAEEAGLRPVNSTVAAFGRFLMHYQDYRMKVRGLNEDAAMSLTGDVETRMNAADPAAMADKDFYWPTVVEQMRDGLL